MGSDVRELTSRHFRRQRIGSPSQNCSRALSMLATVGASAKNPVTRAIAEFLVAA
jgi:hypothetical protein